jgi:hypothetical protein
MNECIAYEKEVVNKILSKLSYPIVKNLGLTVVSISKNLSSIKNEHGEYESVYDSLPSTIDECYEEGMSVEEAVELLYDPYYSLLIGHCSVL